MTDKKVLEQIIANDGNCSKIEDLNCWNCPIGKECGMQSLPETVKRHAQEKLKCIKND